MPYWKGLFPILDRPLSDLSMLSEGERQQLLVDWNQTEVAYPKDRCIHQLMEEQVERTPDATAIVFEDQRLTYRQLNDRANQLARYLQKLGVGPGTLVGICVERSVEMMVGLLGILKAGGAYMPLDASYPRERLAFMLKDAQVAGRAGAAWSVGSHPHGRCSRHPPRNWRPAMGQRIFRKPPVRPRF